MLFPANIRHRLFNAQHAQEFNALALEIFHYQARYNSFYSKFLSLLKVDPDGITNYRNIPFLPIGFFKDHQIISGEGLKAELVFTSSGTTGSVPSRHYIPDLELYRQSFSRAFKLFYGRPESYRFLVLLPGYLERQGSSLVYMMENLVGRTKANGSGFYLQDFRSLSEELKKDNPPDVTTILFGASYALLDFAESPYCSAVNGLVMETGGMKGRRKEMIREELHETLCRKLGVVEIHSEYGMTELLSQAYSKGQGKFRTPPWMKVLIRDINDPFGILPMGKTGGINIIDLANLYSCAFIATQDLGKVHEDGSFEVLGRFDDSDVRGCNLLVV